MKRRAGINQDVTIREFVSGYHGGCQGFLVFVGGLADGTAVQTILASGTRFANPPFRQPQTQEDPVLDFMATLAQTADVSTTQDLNLALQSVLAGDAALFLSGARHAMVVDTRRNVGRQPEEPTTEAEVRGPRDGNTEDVRTNAILLRRRIRCPRLRLRWFTLGARTQTEVVLAYIQGLANPRMVREVRRRLNRIKVDAIQSSNAIEELITDNPLSPFSYFQATERPDRLAAAVLEGRIVLLVDNTPFALIMPTTLWEHLKAAGDYYQSPYVSTAFRLLRFVALITALILPSLYVILATFHHEMLPTPLALSVAAGHEGTPLPTLAEVFLMGIMFEMIQEAGLRLPRAVGQTVSIVGALVIGEASVMAGLMTPSTVIVIAIAGITGFAIPSYSASLAVRWLRFPLLILSGIFGVFGFVTGTAIMALHVASLRSFGAPLLSPIAPFRPSDQKDTLLRLPTWKQDLRPTISGKAPSRRQPSGQKPLPPGGGGRV